MRIKGIKLVNFRNYGVLDLRFEEGYNIIFGDNAQGKTNIIESIFLCAAGRSHRTSKDAELLKYGEDRFYVGLELEKERELPSLIEISYEKETRKKVRINEIPVKKIGDLMGHLNAVIFSPEDLFMVKEGPSERRRFIDMTLSQLRPSYFYDLQQYAKILFQRNMLLKEINEKKELMDTLEVWNEHLVKTGSRIMRHRNEFMKLFGKEACTRHVKLTRGAEELKLEYVPSFKANNLEDLKVVEDDFRKELQVMLKKELQKCTTLLGPQRDDIDIILNEKSTKHYGSQGQQRTSVLSMKLAEIDIMKDETGEYPVLLLDDVLSELDLKRQEDLFETVWNMQTFITCTDKGFFGRKMDKANYYHIMEGKVVMDS